MKFIIHISLFCSTAIACGQSMKFVYHEIGEFGNKMGQTILVDVDNDRDLHWVFGRFGEMYWYEHVSASEWILHDLGKGANTDVGQDGDIDVCTKPWNGSLHLYLENKLVE
jgi:hypothetical protein